MNNIKVCKFIRWPILLWYIEYTIHNYKCCWIYNMTFRIIALYYKLYLFWILKFLLFVQLFIIFILYTLVNNLIFNYILEVKIVIQWHHSYFKIDRWHVSFWIQTYFLFSTQSISSLLTIFLIAVYGISFSKSNLTKFTPNITLNTGKYKLKSIQFSSLVHFLKSIKCMHLWHSLVPSSICLLCA